MKIVFQTTRLEKECNNYKLLDQNYGPENASRIRRRLSQLGAAANLAEVKTLPGTRCHELTGNRKGQIALDLKHSRRLIIEPANDPIPRKSDGGLDWQGITAIRVVEVIDYHGT